MCFTGLIRRLKSILARMGDPYGCVLTTMNPYYMVDIDMAHASELGFIIRPHHSH